MIFTYQNRENSLYNKNNTKIKNNVLVAKSVPPPTDFNVIQTVYQNIYVPLNDNGVGGGVGEGKKTFQIKHPQRNPIRHYRKELTHDSYKTASSRQIINDFNLPGKSIVTNNTENCYNYLNNWIQNQTAPAKLWNSIALNNDGSKIVATIANSGKIYTSNNSGKSWIQTSAPSENWYNVACSDNGLKIAAITLTGATGKIYTSIDSGITWTHQLAAPNNGWKSIAMSSNGSIVAAVAGSKQINVSIDSGVTWNGYGLLKDWTAIAINASGSKLAAAAYNHIIYTSTDNGVTWTPTSSPTKNWISISMNSTGNQIVAGVQGEYIYISTDYGVTWAQTGAPQLLSNWYVSTSGDGSIIVACNLNAGIYISYSSTNFNTWTQIVNSTSWIDIVISRNGNAAYATNTTLQQIWNTFKCYNCLDNSLIFKEEIYPNNETFINGTGYQDISQNLWKCIGCNPEINKIKRASTNYSRTYSSSIKNFLERRVKTYDQNIIYDISKNFIVNNQNVSCKNVKKSTTSLSSRHYLIKNGYNSNNTGNTGNTGNILMNNVCCNLINLNDNNLDNNNKCYPPTCSNRLLQKKNICSN